MKVFLSCQPIKVYNPLFKGREKNLNKLPTIVRGKDCYDKKTN